MTVSVVVAAFARPEPLAGIVAAVGPVPGIELVVVDIGGDPRVAAVADGADVCVTVANDGFAAAVNAGVGRAAGDVVVFCNDDVVLDADVVATLAAAAAAGDAVAVPVLLTSAGEVEPSIFALPGPGRLLLEWAALPDVAPRRTPAALRRRIVKWRDPLDGGVVPAAAATMVAARRDLLLREPLPEAYFLYWEEAEWYWRLARRGVAVRIVPEARVVHLGGRGDVRAEKAALLARNAVRVVRRTRGRWAAIRAVPVVVVWQLRLVVVDVLRRQPPERVAARTAGLRAALASWREAW